MGVPSPPAGPGGLSKTVLYGVGAGCGCLSLIIGVVAVVLIVGAMSRAPSGQPQPQPVPGPTQPRPPLPPPQPQPQPPQPQPRPPQPQPQPPQPGGDLEGLDDLKVGGAHTLRMQGQPPNVTPGEPASVFTRGETIGFRGTVAVVRGTHDILILWVKLEGGNRVTPVAEGKYRWSEADQGQPFLTFVHGTDRAPAGDYAVGVIKVVGQQGTLVVRRPFSLR
jgi:hypothetical protein